MRPTRNDIDNELRAIITADSTDPEAERSARMMIASRQRVTQQLDAQAFARSSRSARAGRKRSLPGRVTVWLSGAVAACIAVIVVSMGTDSRNGAGNTTGTGNNHGTVSTTTVVDEADRAELDMILSETMATVDDVWDRGEVDIDRLIKDRSR